jgi:hypothetical protein
MGNNFWENSEIKREEVLKNIFQINEITKTLLYMKKLKLYLIFELDDDSILKRNTRKIIKVTIFDYDVEKNTAQRRPNPITMTIEDFYNYYNHLMNARSILLKEKMNEDIGELSKSKIEHYGEDESGICPICSENKVNISLPCSHFFCEKCLSTWVVKSESCPLCRFKLTLNKKDPSGVAGAQSWNIIDEVDEVQIEKEQEDTLKLLTKKFFFQNK